MRRIMSLCALILAIALAGCTAESSDADGTQTDVATATPTASPEATPTAADSPSPEPTASPAGPTELAVDWAVPFTITAPAGWAVNPLGLSATSVDILDETGLRSVLAAFLKSPDTSEQWVERLTDNEVLEAGEAQPVEIGGAPGHVVDVRLSESLDTCTAGGGVFPGRCYGIHGPVNDGVTFVIEDDRPARFWVLDVGGETVVLMSDAREQNFEDWVPTIDDVLATLEWGS